MEATASTVEAEPLPLVQPPVAASVETEHPAAASSDISSEDQEIHRKAQRFARLLVDEIKLYNQAKVAEGRKNKDLYDRLKEVIDKSRSTYQKRYGNTVAASGNYFQNEMVRSLAEDDLSIMGSNFRQ
jgi:DNA replication initiation complex subunit (GINS family)